VPSCISLDHANRMETYLSVHQYATFLSPTNFTSPTKFVPERFLPGDQNPYPNDNLSAFQPFLAGRHMCIGYRFAMAEMKLILAKLLFAFDISWGGTPAVEHWGDQQTFIFWQKEPLMIRLKQR
jgi:cytochrome P450